MWTTSAGTVVGDAVAGLTGAGGGTLPGDAIDGLEDALGDAAALSTRSGGACEVARRPHAGKRSANASGRASFNRSGVDAAC